MLADIHPIEIADAPYLWDFLYHAIYAPPETPPLPKSIIFTPELAKYVRDWGKVGDVGTIAFLEDLQVPIGAAWLRLFDESCRGYGYIDDETPELSIAVLPNYRNRGIGTKLLTTLFELERNYHSAISLSVSLNNPALRLYYRFGFQVVSQDEHSISMIKIRKTRST